MSSQHPVVTATYPENQTNGVMVCGINFGYSEADRTRDVLERDALEGDAQPLERASFFSDQTVNNTRFRNRVLKWLRSWGFELATTPGAEGVLEKSLFQTNWLSSQSNTITSDEKISIASLAADADGVLSLIQDRKPKLIMFVGNMLIEAFNDISIRDKVEKMLGKRSGNAEIHTGNPDGYSGTHFKLRAQKFGDTVVMSIPHTATIGLSDDYVASLKPANWIVEALLNNA